MRTWYGFSVERSRVTGATEQFVRSLCPRPDLPGGEYHFGLEAHDRRLAVVLKMLDESSLTPKGHSDARPGDYWLQIDRTYTEHDLDQFEYLWATTGRGWPAGERTEDGNVMLALPYFPKLRNTDYIYKSNDVLIVSDHLKSTLETNELRHLTFKPTIVLEAGLSVLVNVTPPRFERRVPPPRQLSWERLGEEPWWEMTSNLVLPRVSPSMPLGNEKGDPSERTYGVWVYNNNPVWELTYCDKDLRTVEPFDAALTFERWHGPHDECRRMIVSQRFRQTLLNHGLVMGFIPVHVEGRPIPVLDPPERTRGREAAAFRRDESAE